jgi:hypothetical protein
MNWVQRFNRLYYLWAHWPFIVSMAFSITLIVGAFIDDPRFTLATLREFLFVIAAAIFSVTYTRERREFLRAMKAQGFGKSNAVQQR